MTNEQTKPVRSREEQISALWDALAHGKPNPNSDIYSNAAAAHVDEAESRGAEEQRRKHAESEYPSAYRWTYGIGGKWRFAEKMPIATSATRKPKFISPLYIRPANVAALEERIAELEMEKDARDKAREHNWFYLPEDPECVDSGIDGLLSDFAPFEIMKVTEAADVRTFYAFSQNDGKIYEFDTEEAAIAALTREGGE